MNAPTSPSSRTTVFLLLVLCFFIQTGFVYLDFPREIPARELSPGGKMGLALWRKHNCQACHQLHGFGGFLGPDLTNVVARRPYEDWTDVLTRGRKQMPAFEFDENERDAIVAFLHDMNDTGTGYPRFTQVLEDTDAKHLVQHFVAHSGEAVDEAVLRGERTMSDFACHACHRPFAVGIQGAQDLTLAMSFRSPDYARRVMLESLGSMPAHDLTDAQVNDILACLDWMNLNRRKLGVYYANKQNGEVPNWKTVPWFEY